MKNTKKKEKVLNYFFMFAVLNVAIGTHTTCHQHTCNIICIYDDGVHIL